MKTFIQQNRCIGFKGKIKSYKCSFSQLLVEYLSRININFYCEKTYYVK